MPRASMARFVAIAAVALAVPKRLWPQARPAPPSTSAARTGSAFCETPGSASNSP